MPSRLLLADDSITIQRVIELTFADEDVVVTAVGDGASAIARLDAEPPDIVLADIGMPGRSGYEVAEHVRRSPALAHIPVLLLTGASEPADEARVRALGCAGVLVKPFEPQMVIARVRELLRVGRADSAATSAGRQDTGASDSMASAAGSRTAPRRDADDYFAELDAAFASLAAAGERQAPLADPGEREAAAADRSRPAPTTMAGAFEALLGAEQGEPLPAIPGGPTLSASQQEAIAARAAAEAAERLVRAMAPAIVEQVAERLVREEIERLKAG